MVLSQRTQPGARFPARSLARWQARPGYIVSGQSFHFNCLQPRPTLHTHTHTVFRHSEGTYIVITCSMCTGMLVWVYSLVIIQKKPTQFHSPCFLPLTFQLQELFFKAGPTIKEQNFRTIQGMHQKQHNPFIKLSVSSITHSHRIIKIWSPESHRWPHTISTYLIYQRIFRDSSFLLSGNKSWFVNQVKPSLYQREEMSSTWM